MDLATLDDFSPELTLLASSPCVYVPVRGQNEQVITA